MGHQSELTAVKKNAEAEARYLQKYNQAQDLIAKIQERIHDMPAPDGEVAIDWGHFGEIARLVDQLREIAEPEV